MKKIIAYVMVIAMTLAIFASLALNASASDLYSVEFDFLNTSTYESYIVHNVGMKAAGNSKTMGYKGWIGSTNTEGATSVFAFEADAGYVFQNLTLSYRGYSIADGAPDGIHIYVSTNGEADYAAGYTEGNWTLVSSVVNDSTAGTGVNVADPSNRDPDVLRTVDLSLLAMGSKQIYVRFDFYRSTNIDDTPATFFAPAAVTGELLCVDPSATEPVATEPETTEAPVDTVPETTEVPVDTAPETTEAPADTTPETTEAPVDIAHETTEAPWGTEPVASDTHVESDYDTAPNTTEAPTAENKGCGGVIASGAVIISLLGIALISKKRH